MSATIANICRGIRAAINGATLPIAVTAQFAVQPHRGLLSATDGVEVWVVPATASTTNTARSISQLELVSLISVRGYVQAGDDATWESLVELVEQITELVTRERHAGVQCVSATADPLYDPAALREHNQFDAVIRLVHRAFPQ